MFVKKGSFHLSKTKVVIISISVLFICFAAGYYLLGYMGFFYSKYDEGKKVYEFLEDMNEDGNIENVRFENHYYSYSKSNVSDVQYTSNNISLYLDGNQIYSDKITASGPLLNPKSIDLVENDTKKRQICVHLDGGGPAPPLDYFFYIKEGKVMVSH
ncbi:MAG: hypothetical protein Q8930_15655 [Bacillota bacterium]|nr:hypothetical protein [Bacillota bacterium]